MSQSILEMRQLLNAEQAARRLNYTARYIRILHARGHLPGFKAPGGRELRFRPEAIERFIVDNEKLGGQ